MVFLYDEYEELPFFEDSNYKFTLIINLIVRMGACLCCSASPVSVDNSIQQDTLDRYTREICLPLYTRDTIENIDNHAQELDEESTSWLYSEVFEDLFQDMNRSLDPLSGQSELLFTWNKTNNLDKKKKWKLCFNPNGVGMERVFKDLKLADYLCTCTQCPLIDAIEKAYKQHKALSCLGLPSISDISTTAVVRVLRGCATYDERKELGPEIFSHAEQLVGRYGLDEDQAFRLLVAFTLKTKSNSWNTPSNYKACSPTTASNHERTEALIKNPITLE